MSHSRRTFLARGLAVGGLAAAGGAVLPSLASADLVPSTGIETLRSQARSALGPSRITRPSGTDYVRYEDLYRSGDTVTAALARLTQAKIVTFPEGRFSVRDFDSGSQSGISVPAVCRGIVGSGSGTLGGSSGTVFTMDAGSSTKGNGRRDAQGRLYVPVQGSSTPTQLTVLRQANQKSPAVWRNFQVAGTEQGHIFNNFQVFETAGANTVDNVLTSGWSGDAGAPPGETYGLAMSGRGAHVVSRVQADGRRSEGGEIFGAMGLTFQNTSGASFQSCYSHHLRTANFVLFQSVDGKMVGCTSDAASTTSKAIGNGGVNLERTAGFVFTNLVVLGRTQKVHITHSNDNWVFNRYGVYKSVSNGSLKLVNPTYNDLWGNKLLMIQSWDQYWNGDTMSSPPLVTKSDGSTHLTYNWHHKGSQIIS